MFARRSFYFGISLIVAVAAGGNVARAVDAQPDQFSRSITSWLVAGPFDNAEYQGYARDYIGEATVEPEEGKAAGDTAQNADKNWRFFDDRIYCRNLDDYQDLYTFFRPANPDRYGKALDWSVAYAHAYVWSPQQLDCQLRVGSNDGFKAWVNGKPVGGVEGQGRQARRDEDQLPVVLEAGWNRLLLKVANAHGVWGFYARLCGADGAKLAGLEYSAARPDGKLRVTTAALPKGFAEWPYVWMKLNIPEEKKKDNPLANVPHNDPEASPFRLAAAGGTPPYRWEVVKGELPAGLALLADEGEIVGKPIAPGKAEFTVQVTDGEGKKASARQSIEIAVRPNLWVEDAALCCLIHNRQEMKEYAGDPEQQAALLAYAGYSFAMPMGFESDRPHWPTKFRPHYRPQATAEEIAALATAPDPLGDFVKAVRGRGVRMGFYCSFGGGEEYENYYKRYVDDRNALAEEISVRYKPAVLWFDGVESLKKNIEFDALFSVIKTVSPETLIIVNSGNDHEYGMGDIDILAGESEGGETLDWYWGRWPMGQQGYNPKKMPSEVWRFPNGGATFMNGNEFMRWDEWARVAVSMRCEGVICDLDHTDHKNRSMVAMRLALAEWMHPRIHTLQGTKPGPLQDDIWGYDVIKGNTIYLHIIKNERGKYGFFGKSKNGLIEPMKDVLGDRPWLLSVDKKLTVKPLPRGVKRVYQVPIDMNLNYEVKGDELTIDMTRVAIDLVDTIIAVELE